MIIEYTKRASGFEQGVSYRNPQYYASPERCESVVLDGDYPGIKADYEAIGVKVEVKGAPAEEEAVSEQDEPSERDLLAAEYEERFGKAPHGKMKTETLREKLEQADEGEE